MSTVYKTKKSVGYFEALPKGTQELVKELILEAANSRNGPEGYQLDSDCMNPIKCHSRDGFTAFDHNRGGVEYRNFTQQMEYFSGGYELAHNEANKKLQSMINETLVDISKQLAEEIGTEDFEYYFSSDLTKVNWPYIEEIIRALEAGDSEYGLKDENLAKLRTWSERASEVELEALCDENATVMHEFRFMYHGKNAKGLHSASVSAAVNLEAPYHRSSISWAPSVFCEGGKEIEITWKNQAELKRKLSRALKQVSKAIF